MFGNPILPVIDMGALYQFEKAARVSAPVFIEHLVQTSSDTPDAPLAPDVVNTLITLIAYCFGDVSGAHKRSAKLLKTSPDLVALALRDFLEDPLPHSVSDPASGEDLVAELPSVLDMRAAWLARGGQAIAFDGLTLWEHSRILRQQEQRQKAALVDAAVAARVAQSKEDKFKRFLSEMLSEGRANTPREWVQNLFNATAHLPKVTQEELSLMKGRA